VCALSILLYPDTPHGCPQMSGFRRYIGETFWTDDLLGTCGRSGAQWPMERLAAECKGRCDCKSFNENGCFKKVRGVELVEVKGNPSFCHYEAMPRAECICPTLPGFKVRSCKRGCQRRTCGCSRCAVHTVG
jgi:hypothetical protein